MIKFLLCCWLASVGKGSDSLAWYKGYVDEAARLESSLVAIRREIHKNPEIGLSTYETAERILREVETLASGRKSAGNGPLTVKKGLCKFVAESAGAGIVAELGKGSRVLLLRADTDALPILEQTNLPFASHKPGLMHACGHDFHTTILIGAMKILVNDYESGTLKNLLESENARIRFVFQPGEEGHFGADYMIEEGLLDGVEAAYALHVFPGLPPGTIVAQPGHAMAGGYFWNMTIMGKGGHVGTPGRGRDPIVAAAALIQSWQTIPSRFFSGIGANKVPLLSVARFESGDGANNVIPEKVVLGGVLRALVPTALSEALARFQMMADNILKAYDCKYELALSKPVKPLFNDDALLKKQETLVQTASEVPITLPPGAFTYGMEDFAHIAAIKPAFFFGLGVGPESGALHSPTFNPDEKALRTGAAFMAGLARNHLTSKNIPADKKKAEL